MPSGTNPIAYFIYSGLGAALILILLFRFGLLTVIVGNLFQILLTAYPMTTDPSTWYAGYTLLALLAAGAIAGYGFRVALSGRMIHRTISERQSL